MKQRSKPSLIKIFQFDFPDTAEFRGCLMDSNYIPNESAELYSQMALLLFTNYRQPSDMLTDESFTETFRRHVLNGSIGSVELQFLQNIQDVKSNCFRSENLDDSLARDTNQYEPADIQHDMATEEEDDSELHGSALDTMLRLFDTEFESSNASPTPQDEIPQKLNFGAIRNKGAHKCGYDQIAKIYEDCTQPESPIVTNSGPTQTDLDMETTEDVEGDNTSPQANPSVSDIVKLLLERTTTRMQTFQEITGCDDPINLLEANGSVESIIDWAKKAKLDRRQKRAFEILAGTFVMSFYLDAPLDAETTRNTRNRTFLSERQKLKILLETNRRGSNQLVLFLHGPGGSGKTTVIDLLMEYARQYCDNLGYTFTSKTIVVTAMSGVAATILRGETTHRAVYLNQKKPLEAEQIEAWEETRMLIVDEISFASKEEFSEIHEKLSRLKQKLSLPYGGLHIVFAGDLRQLEPVSDKFKQKRPVYEETCIEFKEWVNCYIELQGTHRFKKDPLWGQILLRFRNGTVTTRDIDDVNERVANVSTVLPKQIRYATYFNRDRDSINTGLFEERCRDRLESTGNLDDTILVLCDQIQVETSDKTYRTFGNWKTIWENCGEDDMKMKCGRMDPVLRLYAGCRVMLTENMNVKDGLANGTQALVESIVLNNDETSKTISIADGVSVQAVLASQVSHIVLRHVNDRISPSTFSIKPKMYKFRARVPKPQSLLTSCHDKEIFKMKALQLPAVSNNATTGHKLQGSGVENLFVHNWSYVTNWVYVMLSRVRTKDGLFSRNKLSKDLTKYQVPELLMKMLSQFEPKSPTYWTDDEYHDTFDV